MSYIHRLASDLRSQPRINNDVSLVPTDSIGGRALVIVIAIMTFLVCLAGGGATLIAEASLSWRDLVSKDVTIQIKPRPNEDTDSIVKQVAEVAARTPGVEFVHALSQRELERILEPWLGQGLNLSQLPIPRIIVVTMDLSHQANLRDLEVALASSAPQASLDDHQVWVSRLQRAGLHRNYYRRWSTHIDRYCNVNRYRLCDAGCDGGQSRDHRGFAFRRRRRRVYCEAISSPFYTIGSAWSYNWRFGRSAMLRSTNPVLPCL